MSIDEEFFAFVHALTFYYPEDIPNMLNVNNYWFNKLKVNWI